MSGCPPGRSCGGRRGGWWRRSRAEPFLDFGHLGLVFEGIRRRGRAHGMHAQPVHLDVDPGVAAVFGDDVLVDGARMKRLFERARAVVSHRAEEGSIRILQAPAVLRQLRQVFLNQPLRHLVHGNVADLAPLAAHLQVHHALAGLHVAEAEQAKLLAADAVIEQGGEYGAIHYTLQRVEGRGLKQSAGLRLAERRRAAFVAVDRRALDAVHRIAAYRVTLAEILI